MSSTSVARSRARAEPATAPAPAYTAKLIEAQVYHLTGGRFGPDMTFKRGEEVAISPEVFAHLAEQTRIITHRETGRIVQEQRRLFALRGPDGATLPRPHSETVRHLDGADEPDPWAS
jgi:hypothetical protein